MNNKKKNNLKAIFNVISLVKKISPLYIVVVIIDTIFSSLFPFINIIFSYWILDDLINEASKSVIMNKVYLLIGLNLIFGIIIALSKSFIEKQGTLIEYNLTRTIANKGFTLDYEQTEDNEIMNMIQQARDGSNGSGGIGSFIHNTFNGVFSSILQIIYSLILLSGLIVSITINDDGRLINFINNPLSASIILMVLIISVVVSTVLSIKESKLGYQVMMENIDGNRRFGYFYNVCVNYKKGKEIRLYDMHDMLIGLMKDKRFSIEENWERFVNVNIKFLIINNFFNKVLLFIAYLYVGLKAIYGLISIGSVVSYVAAITTLNLSVTRFLRSFVTANQQASYLQHYFSYINLNTKMQYGKKEFNSNDIEVEFKNVSFAYVNQKEKVLNNVSFKLNSKEKLAIVGLNGSGKTTLVKLLCRLYDPNEGSITVNGIDIKEYSKEALTNIYAVVFQDFKLFSYSIKENVAGGKEVDDERVIKSLDKAGIMDRVNKMEKGIDTILYQRGEEKGVEVSGGEAQKIALARALYKDSALVILDEPTSALDPESEAQVYEGFKDMVQSKTSIFISHRLSSCKFCDNILVLDKGNLVEIGSHNELMRKENLYYKMWNAQAKYYK
ncbi:MAG: ABC transporter ATP-binding protein [Acholeplasma sp.]|nr:ABC transporter ATP-binding protein [Acholeplasma sp.]